MYILRLSLCLCFVRMNWQSGKVEGNCSTFRGMRENLASSWTSNYRLCMSYLVYLSIIYVMRPANVCTDCLTVTCMSMSLDVRPNKKICMFPVSWPPADFPDFLFLFFFCLIWEMTNIHIFKSLPTETVSEWLWNRKITFFGAKPPLQLLSAVSN